MKADGSASGRYEAWPVGSLAAERGQEAGKAQGPSSRPKLGAFVELGVIPRLGQRLYESIVGRFGGGEGH